MIFKGIEICCPHCKGDLQGDPEAEESALQCATCSKNYPVILGIPDLRVFPDPYIDIEPDRAKGRRVAERFDDLKFAELVAYYYSVTDVVPPNHARQYTRGLLAAADRAKNALSSWEPITSANGKNSLRFLDVGCGTAPLMVAAAPHYAQVVGIDIAFRWLVVAKKRLADAGLDLPLLCACAEALPFPDESFDRVALDSVIETVRDQQQTLGECHRVLGPGSYLFAATPNRYSLGPDPHTGLWAGSLLPDRWTAAYVRRLGGIPPERRLLSAPALARLLRENGFDAPQITLPDIPAEQRAHLSWAMNRLVGGYHSAKRLPVSRHILRGIGPLLHAVAQKHASQDSASLRTASVHGLCAY